ncbi:hypothetical protein OH76DRAFT_321617 [Lentinus brumalis]|uniref:Uncharacterized protein n=1 Tax=Lentinus brumalis TaxID=2498619 RepID=A0A371DFF0_9APHY|nr:hypothetical protein OH76DRAFT_321617 [Polyporus brumalis]
MIGATLCNRRSETGCTRSTGHPHVPAVRASVMRNPTGDEENSFSVWVQYSLSACIHCDRRGPMWAEQPSALSRFGRRDQGLATGLAGESTKKGSGHQDSRDQRCDTRRSSRIPASTRRSLSAHRCAWSTVLSASTLGPGVGEQQRGRRSRMLKRRRSVAPRRKRSGTPVGGRLASSLVVVRVKVKPLRRRVGCLGSSYAPPPS